MVGINLSYHWFFRQLGVAQAKQKTSFQRKTIRQLITSHCVLSVSCTNEFYVLARKVKIFTEKPVKSFFTYFSRGWVVTLILLFFTPHTFNPLPQIDMQNKIAWVHADQSKNGKVIRVPLNQGAIDVLINQLGNHHTRVFTYRGKPITKVGTKWWRKALERAGIENFT